MMRAAVRIVINIVTATIWGLFPSAPSGSSVRDHAPLCHRGNAVWLTVRAVQRRTVQPGPERRDLDEPAAPPSRAPQFARTSLDLRINVKLRAGTR